MLYAIKRQEETMAVSYKKLLHKMIEDDISNQDLMKMSNISANIITCLLYTSPSPRD